MNIYLNAQKTIRDVQKEFSSEFPFLRVEFFKHRHATEEGSPLKEILPSSAELIEITGVVREGMIDIGSDDQVAIVEKRFADEFGLPVQVFRKQKAVWLETTATDHLTLKEQNEMGRIASETEVKEPSDRFVDWD